MDQLGNKPDVDDDRTFGQDVVVALWKAYRAGEVVSCPRDGASLALSIDGAARSYRFVCSRCGISSAWFETAATGIHVRMATIPMSAPSDD